jgi:hypothetical protein
MWIVIAIAMAITVPFVVALHYRRSAKRLVVADKAWGSLEYHAHTLLQDKTLDPTIGDFVEGVVNRVGDGYLTRSFLAFLVMRPRAVSPETSIGSAFNRLESGQRVQFYRFMVDAIYYDSLRTAFSGAILRRLALYWLESTAKDEASTVSESQVKPIAAAAGRAFGLSPC